MSPFPTVRFLLSLLAPGGVLVLGARSLLGDDAVRDAAAPYAVYFCFGAVMLTVTALQLRPNTPAIAKLAALLLPLNFIVFASLAERGLLTRRGLQPINTGTIRPESDPTSCCSETFHET